MKLKFTPIDDETLRIYCTQCQGPEVRLEGPNEYRCSQCGYVDARVIMIDPAVEWWLSEAGDYCHATAGIFVADEQGRFLFFDRNRFPFGLTVPAGHVDKGEAPEASAARELAEEVGLVVEAVQLRAVGCDELWSDSCRRGADMHRWHSFAIRAPVDFYSVVDPDEGGEPRWLTLEEALALPLTPATRMVIMRNRHRLDALSQDLL